MATTKSAAAALFLVLALILCLGVSLSAGPSPSAAAELTAADKRLFDAVWANDMAAVRRVLAEGANPAATDDNGMSAVDVAVDRGYFEIAHYLLAVQNQRRYTADAPAPRSAPSAAPAAPAMVVPRTTLPAPPQPAPAPAPAPVVVAAPVEASPAAPAVPAVPPAPSARQNVVVDPALPDFLTEEKVEFINPEEFLKARPTDPAEPSSGEAESGGPVELPAAVQPAPQPTTLPPAEAEAPNLFQRFTNLFGSDDEKTASGDEAEEAETVPEREATASGEDAVLVRRKSAPQPKTAPVTKEDPQPAPTRPAAPTVPAAAAVAAMATEEEQAAKPPEPPEAVASPPVEDEAAKADTDQPAPVGEPERGPPQPLAMREDTPSSAAVTSPAATPGEPGQSEVGSFFDKITDFLKTNLEPDPEPAVPTSRPASQVAATKTETLKTAVEAAPQEPVAAEPATAEPVAPASTADAAASAKGPVVEKAEVPTAAADSTADPAQAKPAEAAESDIAAEATKSLNEGLADLGEMFGKVGDFFTEGIMGKPELPPATVTDENAGIARASGAGDDGDNSAGTGAPIAATERATAPAAKRDVPEGLPPPRPVAPEVAARTAGEGPATLGVPQPEPVPAQPIRTVGTQDMVLGSTGWLGKRLIYDEAAAAACVEKAAWKSRFCIEEIDWPESMRAVFRGGRGVFGAGKAIVRYIGGVASQYHVVFPTQAYGQVSAHFTERFGPPHETPDVWATLLGEPKRFNKTLRWHAKDISGPGMVLEIREIDDLRWSAPPDVKNGVVRLHHKGAGTVFEHLTTADLLLIQVQKGAHSAVAAPAQPAGIPSAKPQ